MNTKPLIILGQTATGKTKLGINLAKRLSGEIISFDSRQLYKHMDVVTGKDIKGAGYVRKKVLDDFSIGFYMMEGVPVWLYDIVSPSSYFSAYDWMRCVSAVLPFLKSAPIFVGGTYFYTTFLFKNISHEPHTNWDRRKKLEELSVEQLQDMLRKLNDAVFSALNNSDKNNKRRLIRHVEKISDSVNAKKLKPPLYGDAKLIGLYYDDVKNLYEALERRVDERLSMGAVKETELLLRMGYTKTDPGMQAIGYRQIIEYLNDECTLDEARLRWIVAERQYAKRQITFMKKDPRITWYAVDRIPIDRVEAEVYTYLHRSTR